MHTELDLSLLNGRRVTRRDHGGLLLTGESRDGRGRAARRGPAAGRDGDLALQEAAEPELRRPAARAALGPRVAISGQPNALAPAATGRLASLRAKNPGRRPRAVNETPIIPRATRGPPRCQKPPSAGCLPGCLQWASVAPGTAKIALEETIHQPGKKLPDLSDRELTTPK